ncbi:MULTISPECIES: AfsR/SARP family transcriptional regulator [Streptomyces]|uniref:AfsR/SARP family transcriptional regulator n=1 Tax=Streptomyces TaxID=1883 RepID=UPI00048D7131|nr:MULTISPECIES: BTAD domain-containing putative transcriptional regulator [Streptomyces]MYR75338.1 AAA family ATPase [Streptomyces sp. SID4925]MYY18075.1 AAA family ATPase [Streptomyces sp. SID4912]SBU88043.1 DNA-binding transcriptional activator of the SARP family [Streptomyces sp. OspMP-M45]SCD39588.1 DNA-binding transcriptional activator of the SARP family [Streptomyces sp. DpondAA-D4]SCE26868.1 DNA-binding transcriptional activator of the SARP family [Streptomyces sp. PpalLS-921]
MTRPPARPAPTGSVYFSLLGPLTAVLDGRPLPLGPRKQRLVLATLLARPNTPVPVDVLTDVVWPEAPPRTARKNLQVYVSAARTLFGAVDGGDRDRVVHGCGGYRLRIEEGELDTLRFRALARAGRAAGERGDLRTAARLLREALDLWGERPPLHDLRDSAVVADEAERLEARCLTVYEDWAEAEIETGRAAAAVDGLRDLVERHPLRERLRAAWMNSLHQSGRQAEALEVYDDYRQLLARELGLEPSPALAALYGRLLGRGAAPRPAGPRPAARDVSLPADLRVFTGRDDELARLLPVAGAPDGGVVVVTGPAGVGKSALAVRAAHLLAEDFPDGRVHVRARHQDGTARVRTDMLEELLRLCGAGTSGRPDAAEAEGAWQDWLSRHRALVVLDDVADEASVRGLLPRSGRSSVLLTARGLLAGLAPVHRIALSAPEEDEALDLLGRLIGADRLRTDRAAALRIVRACGALPVAVAVSGMRLAVLRHLPLAEYAARVEDPSAALDELVAGDVSVRSRIAAGWRDLGPGDRGALARLADLAPDGGFTLERAMEALGCGERGAIRTVESLIGTGAVTSPAGEVTAHAALYEVPRLFCLYARERSGGGAGGPGAGVPEPALPFSRG